jgi:methylmalonyl-CoA mutase
MTDVSRVDDLVLAADFPAASREQWLALVAKVVGVDDPADAERELTTRLFADVETMPLYVGPLAADPGLPGQGSFVRGRTTRGSLGGWDVRVRHDHPVPQVAHEHILEDLEGGATSLWLVLGDGAMSPDALAQVLDEVYLDLITVSLDGGADFGLAAERFLQVVRDRSLDAKPLAIRLGADPIGFEAATGKPADLDEAVALAAWAARNLPNSRALTVDALPVHLAGADDAQELGYSLAAGVEYLRAMQAAGVDSYQAFDQIEFRYAATADQFLTIAKLRAARQVWSTVAQSCGVNGPAGGQLQHAVGSPAMLTQRDPWNNILRGTLAGFAAGVGGADAITIAPFDAAIGYSDRLARRIARNTHALLVEESNVARTIDPAGGSWYVEQLTHDVAARAWDVFQTIERSGGALASLRSGAISELVESARNRRLDELSHREATITGVTEYPLAGEVVLDREPRANAESTGLPHLRWAQRYEAARDRSDRYAVENGEPPTVSTFRRGDPKQSGKRQSAIAAALASAGIRSDPSDDPRASRAVAVVCAADDVDADELRAFVQLLRSEGAELVVEQTDDALDVVALHDLVLTRLGVPA